VLGTEIVIGSNGNATETNIGCSVSWGFGKMGTWNTNKATINWEGKVTIH